LQHLWLVPLLVQRCLVQLLLHLWQPEPCRVRLLALLPGLRRRVCQGAIWVKARCKVLLWVALVVRLVVAWGLLCRRVLRRQ
jgi:hypothetical protein